MRRSFLILGLIGALAVPMVALPAAAPAARGGKKALKRLNKTVKADHASIGVLSTKLTNLTTTLGTATATLGQLASGGQKVQAALTTIQGVLTTLGNGLTALSNAVSNTTTGLPGLNAARPQFGAFKADGTIIAGTGQSPPASGPSANATRTGPGTYIVDFGNDVSKRFLSVTSFPTGAAPVIGSAVNCSAAGNPCTAADTSPNHVFVLWQSTASPFTPTDPTNGWEVAALSG